MIIDNIKKLGQKIHGSFKTVLQFFDFLHTRLLVRFHWYYKWSLNPYRKPVNYAVVTILCLALVLPFALPNKKGLKMVLGAESSIPIQDDSIATVINTGESIYFSSAIYHANVTIDNYAREMSGYAWSADMGWIYFGGGNSNTEGPVTADISGNLSGKAKVINGGYIDFNASPTGANAVVSTPGGVFSGFAWSEDLGWINFTGVSAPAYNPDLLAPDNPASVTAKSTSTGAVLTTDTWYNYSTPYFSWTAPSDNASLITPSGVAGYYVYFGTTGSTDPVNYQTNLDFTSPNLGSSFGTYYFRVKTKDVAGNISSPVTLFTYKYENAAPTAPAYVSVTPSGYSRTNTFTFSWPITGANAAVDTGGSGLLKYQYKINGETNWHDVTGDGSTASVTLTDAASLGSNVFHLQAVDVAGNASTSVQTMFYFNNTAPLAPASLTATPTSNMVNNFGFSWTVSPGEIAGYYYSVNAIPTLANTNFTTSTSLSAGPYATVQGQNIMYVVAKDNAGNYDFSGCSPTSVNYNHNTDTCAAVAFTATTTAPGVPGGLQVYDNSDRDSQDYAVTVKWTEPTNPGAGFAGYDVYRSADGITYTKIGSTLSVAYADTGLSSQIYFYYVVSKDNAGQFSALTTPISITPTGKFTSPPVLVSGPTSVIAPTSITVSWATDRVCSSFVQIKEGNTFVSEQGQTEQTTNHTVKVVGLRSQRDYIYNIRSTDVDGNILTGDDMKFTTANTPSVYDLAISNITQTSAIINFKSTAIANFTLYYGETADYGNIVTEDSSSTTTNHSLAIANLKPGTMYYFRVIGDDTDGNELRSENSFLTLPMPTISNLAIQTDKEAITTTIKVSWITNVPTTSILRYAADGVNFSELSTADMVTAHEITISDLQDLKKYTIYAAGRDQFGNLAESDRVTFDTPKDSRPPKISDFVVESQSNEQGGDTFKVVVSWKTDEPATSKAEFGVGVGDSNLTQSSTETTTLDIYHVVVVSGLESSQVYQFKAVSKDAAGNLAQSDSQILVTNQPTQTIFALIMQSLEKAFGWMGKLFK